MHFKFELTEEDIVAFSREFYATSPTVRKSRMLNRWALPVILVVFAFLNLRDAVIDWVTVSVFLLVSLTWYFVSPRLFDRRIEKYTRRMAKEESYRKLFGPCELIIDEDGLRSSNSMGQSTLNWSALRSVKLTNTHLHIFLSGPIGYPVPLAFIGREAAEQAAALLRTKISAPLAITHP